MLGFPSRVVRGIQPFGQVLSAGYARPSKALRATMAANALAGRKPYNPPKPPKAPVPGSNPKLVKANKSNIDQSPLKMKFLVSLVRDTWMPDAIAQMKFSPKHKAEDVMKILKRACALAKLNHNAIPEELYVEEVLIGKGDTRKRYRIMGRGHTGVSRIRSTHVTVKVGVIDWAQRIACAPNYSQKAKWHKRRLLAERLKAEAQVGGMTIAPAAASIAL